MASALTLEFITGNVKHFFHNVYVISKYSIMTLEPRGSVWKFWNLLSSQ